MSGEKSGGLEELERETHEPRSRLGEFDDEEPRTETKYRNLKTKTKWGVLKSRLTDPGILINSVMMFESIGYGSFQGIWGATLLDLEQITGTTTAQVSLTFTAMTVGSLLGTPLAGYLMDRINYRLVIAVSLVGLGVLTPIVPAASNFIELMAISGILGIFNGMNYCSRNFICVHIWGKNGAVLVQIFGFFFGLGTFIAPWLAAPFLSPDVPRNTSYSTHTTELPYLQSTVETGNILSEETTESRVFFAFLIIGLYCIVASGLFLLSYLRIRKRLKAPTRESSQKTKGTDNIRSNSNEPKWFIYSILTLLCLRYVFNAGLATTTPALLMTFVVKGLGWTKSQGIALKSCFRGVFLAGKLCIIIFAMTMSPTKMVLMSLSITVAGLSTLTFCIHFHHLVLWISISMVAFGMGALWGASLSWIGKHLNITGKRGSVFLIGNFIGLISLHPLTGYLFDEVSPFSYLYVGFVDGIALTCFTLAAMALSAYYQKQRRRESYQNKPENIIL